MEPKNTSEPIENPEANTPPVPAPDPYGIIPEKQEQRDEDLLTVLRNKPLYRKIAIAPKYEIVIQDLKTRHVIQARRMAIVRTGMNAGTVDPTLSAYYEMAFGLCDCIIDGKSTDLPPIDSETEVEIDREAFLKAFDKRINVIGSWPAPMWNRAITALKTLVGYVETISAPDQLVNF